MKLTLTIVFALTIALTTPAIAATYCPGEADTIGYTYNGTEDLTVEFAASIDGGPFVVVQSGAEKTYIANPPDGAESYSLRIVGINAAGCRSEEKYAELVEWSTRPFLDGSVDVVINPPAN